MVGGGSSQDGGLSVMAEGLHLPGKGDAQTLTLPGQQAQLHSVMLTGKPSVTKPHLVPVR